MDHRDTLLHQALEVTLEGAPGNAGNKSFERFDAELAVFQQNLDRYCLSVIQAVLPGLVLFGALLVAAALVTLRLR